MPSLKDLRNRISSVKSTKKITSAMKMVAAAKLKKAQDNAIAARPYAERMSKIISSLKKNSNFSSDSPSLITGTGINKKVLLLVCSADRGLCGGFNSSIIKYTNKIVKKYKTEGKEVKFIFIGKKAKNALIKQYKNDIVEFFTDVASPEVDFEQVKKIRNLIIENFNKSVFDRCEIVYTKFLSAISQEVKMDQLVPLNNESERFSDEKEVSNALVYDFEPSEEEILESIVPENLAMQILTGLLESTASEHGSRMTAMDNATRNANDKIDDLTMFYNRSRQAVITKELIEIISGAEAI
ncbi:MAG: F0F1 ATP synthase subunit gamma [Rickettsiales bacterium]|nr:F0F1 ATP synthase subunit gamma [Rickettsiales bacterium]OUV54558.1 MAG: F0F1 ATP synthase subunit gamma [Rickettsiales bacterium TMED127]